MTEATYLWKGFEIWLGIISKTRISTIKESFYGDPCQYRWAGWEVPSHCLTDVLYQQSIMINLYNVLQCNAGYEAEHSKQQQTSYTAWQYNVRHRFPYTVHHSTCYTNIPAHLHITSQTIKCSPFVLSQHKMTWPEGGTIGALEVLMNWHTFAGRNGPNFFLNDRQILFAATDNIW